MKSVWTRVVCLGCGGIGPLDNTERFEAFMLPHHRSCFKSEGRIFEQFKWETTDEFANRRQGERRRGKKEPEDFSFVSARFGDLDIGDQRVGGGSGGDSETEWFDEV